MRIATWNVERPKNADSPRSRRILQQLQAVDADVWILTETHDAITPGPDYQSSATEPVPDPPTRHGDGERRTIIWSRWPIVEHVDADLAHRTACARLQTPACDLLVFGTIIPYSGRDCAPYGKLRRWDAHYSAIAMQGAYWQRLLRRYPNSGLCVGGDFNQTREGGFSYGTKWGRALLDLALQYAGLQDVTVPSFARRQEVNSSGWQLADSVQPIDHICLTTFWAKRVTAVGAWPGESSTTGYLSDHSGVWVDIVP